MRNMDKGERWIYFAYGMNMNQDGMAARCATAKYIGTARLFGWGRVERGVYDIKPSDGRFVDGVLFEIGEWDLHHLDRLEGYPRFYNRLWVNVRTSSGESITTMTYSMANELGFTTRGDLSPSYARDAVVSATAAGIDITKDWSLSKQANSMKGETV